jgi:hypothetical protein
MVRVKRELNARGVRVATVDLASDVGAPRRVRRLVARAVFGHGKSALSGLLPNNRVVASRRTGGSFS